MVVSPSGSSRRVRRVSSPGRERMRRPGRARPSQWSARGPGPGRPPGASRTSRGRRGAGVGPYGLDAVEGVSNFDGSIPHGDGRRIGRLGRVGVGQQDEGPAVVRQPGPGDGERAGRRLLPFEPERDRTPGQPVGDGQIQWPIEGDAGLQRPRRPGDDGARGLDRRGMARRRGPGQASERRAAWGVAWASGSRGRSGRMRVVRNGERGPIGGIRVQLAECRVPRSRPRERVRSVKAPGSGHAPEDGRRGTRWAWRSCAARRIERPDRRAAHDLQFQPPHSSTYSADRRFRAARTVPVGVWAVVAIRRFYRRDGRSDRAALGGRCRRGLSRPP